MPNELYIWCPTCEKVTGQVRPVPGMLRCRECDTYRNEKLKDPKVRNVFTKVRS